tara:strand:+ start:49493 stop:52078 length:2586 start_codon:yes stop_codon:yes gene_type:complete
MRLQSFRTYLLNKKKISLIVIFLSIFQFSIAQNDLKKIPLTEVIAALESRFNVRFSYNEQLLQNIKVVAPNVNDDLEKSLTFLKISNPIEFTQIGERYIAIRFNARQISVCGTIINTQTGSPLSGVSLITNSSQTGTDKGGNFSLSGISEIEIIRVYYLGLELKKIIARDLLNDSNKCPLVFVNDDLNLLPTVILHSYITKGISKNANGSVTIYNKNFEILPSLIEPDILQIAQVLPGVESFDETASNINVRGGKSDELLLLWDDMRVYQSGHFFGLISAFNPNLTQDVTIYKNGTSPRYGESVSGVISMRTDNEIPEEISGGLGVNLSSASVYAKIPASESLSFTVSGRTSINNGIGNPVYKEFFKRTFQNTVVTNLQNNTSEGLRSTDEKFNFYDIGLKGLWNITKNDKIRYNFLTVNNKLQFTERFVSSENSDATISNLNQRTSMNGLSYERDWSRRFSSTALWYATQYFLDEANRDVETDEATSQRNKVKENGLKIDFSYIYNDILQLKTGYQYTKTDVTDTESSSVSSGIESTTNTVTSHAFFADSKWSFFQNKTKVNFGIRFTNYPNLKASYFEPRINLFHKLSDAVSIFTSAELKNQSIIQFIDIESNLLGVENKKWIAANEDDNPILESKQVSLGAIFSKNNWSFTSEGFFKVVDNIAAQNQGFRNQLENSSEIGSYESKGIEFSISKQTERLSAWFSYTFMKNDYTFNNLAPATFRSNLDVRHAFNLAASYSIGNFKFSLGNTYHSGLPYTSPASNTELITNNGVSEIQYNTPNNESLDNYFRTDFSALYDFKIDETFRGKINLAMLNILNRKNALATYYRMETGDDGNSIINRIDKFSLGFTPNISFLLLF